MKTGVIIALILIFAVSITFSSTNRDGNKPSESGEEDEDTDHPQAPVQLEPSDENACPRPPSMQLSASAAEFVPKYLPSPQITIPQASTSGVSSAQQSGVPYRFEVTHPELPNSIVDAPENPPIIDLNNWPPRVAVEEAQNLIAYTFRAHNPNNLEGQFYVIRLPFMYSNGMHVDCIVLHDEAEDAPEISFLENAYIVLFENSTTPKRIDIHEGPSAGRMKWFFMNLEYLYPDRNEIYVLQTWIVTTHREDQDEQPPYGYYIIRDGESVPLNAYKPFMFDAEIIRTSDKSLKDDSKQFIKLAVMWVPSQCIYDVRQRRWVREEICLSKKWLIHGFWIGLKGKDDTVNVEYILPATDYALDGMQENWLSVRRGEGNERFWTKEWLKHGEDLGFESPLQYFNATLTLFFKQETQSLLEHISNLANDFELHNLIDFKGIVQQSAGHFVDIACNNIGSEVKLFREIRLCFQKDESGEFQIDNCYHDEDNCRAEHMNWWLKHPENFHMFSYIMLSLSWMPTQVARLRDMQNKIIAVESNTFWKIHSLCPGSQHNVLYTNYRFDLYYLYKQNFWGSRFSGILHGILANVWHSFTFQTDIDFWRLGYEECGVLMRMIDIPRLRGTVKYFQESVAMMMSLNSHLWFSAQQLDIPVPANYISRQITDVIGVNVTLVCYWSDGISYLVKVRVCYGNGPDLALINCPESSKIKLNLHEYEQTECDQMIVIPSHSHL